MATFGPLGDAEFLRSVGGGLMDSANRGVAATIGAPVDASAAALNLLIAGGGAAAHGLGLINASQLPGTIDAPVGGSEWIGRLMQQAGMVSDNRNPIAEALMAALLPGAMAKAGPKVFAAEQAWARNAAAPNTMGPRASQRGAVAVGSGKLTRKEVEYTKSLIDKVEKLAEEHGTVYVRWSPTSKRDLAPGAKSRDFVSGETHAGLSAVPVTADMHPVDIAKAIREYGGLRTQDARSVPRIYAGRKVGEDSDGYASIVPSKLLLEPDKKNINHMDRKFAELMDYMDSLETAKIRRARVTDRTAQDVYDKEIEKLSKEISKLYTGE